MSLISVSRDFLRAAKNGNPVDEFLIGFIATSANHIIEELSDDNAKKVFWLNLYNAFIQNHFGKRKITIKIISDIYSWARGQTYTIQLQCNRLFELNKSIEEADLHEIRESLLKQEAPVFANYSNLLSDGQFNLLKAIAKDEAVQNPQASEFLLSHNLGAASTVRSALKSLINKELVIKEANNYLVHDVLFARWLQRL